jgi:AcrR family transcriptional regulator
MFVMHPEFVREKACQLRISKRLTIDQLADRLGVSRTTVHYWVRDLPLPTPGPGGEWPEAARRKGTKAMQAKYRRLREEAYEEGRRSFSTMAADPTFRDFVCMYIGEGSKRVRNEVALCNSDPAVIRLADRWIKRLAVNKIGYGLQYHADQDVSALARFWAGQVDCEPNAIRLQRKSNSNQLTGRTWRSIHGVLTVSVGDTLLRAKLEAWMDCARASWV